MQLSRFALSLAHLCSKDESRFTLQSIQIDESGITATNGHALIHLEHAARNEWSGITFLLSRKAAGLLRKMFSRKHGPTVEVTRAGGGTLVFDGDGLRVAIDSAEGKFPEWKPIIKNIEAQQAVSIDLNAGILRGVVDLLAKYTEDQPGTTCRKVTLFVPQVEGKAVKLLTTGGEGATCTAYIMPLRAR